MNTKIFRSKSNLYGGLLVFVFLMMVTVILASESTYFFGNNEDGARYGGLVYSFFQCGFIIYAIFLLKKLIYSNRLIKVLYILAVLATILSIYVSNPFVKILEGQAQTNVFIFFHVTLLICELLFMRVILKNIFGIKETRSDHIWGAIVVYFLLIMTFSEVYEIITLLDPGLLGGIYVIGFPNYVQCIMFSINSITGVEAIYPQAATLLTKIGNLENLVGSLFLVVILGRLLSYPIDQIRGRSS